MDTTTLKTKDIKISYGSGSDEGKTGNYYKQKEKARREAWVYQMNAEEYLQDMEDVMLACAYFSKKAKIYGLIKEFKENDII